MGWLNDSCSVVLGDGMLQGSEKLFDLEDFAFFPKPEKKKPNILIVDDDVELGWLLKSRLRREFPYIEISTASDPYEAINMVHENVYSLILLDWNLQDLNGREMLKKAEEEFRIDPAMPDNWFINKPAVVVLSADSKDKCKIGNLDHFRYCGHIDKAHSLELLMTLITECYRVECLNRGVHYA